MKYEKAYFGVQHWHELWYLLTCALGTTYDFHCHWVSVITISNLNVSLFFLHHSFTDMPRLSQESGITSLILRTHSALPGHLFLCAGHSTRGKHLCPYAWETPVSTLVQCPFVAESFSHSPLDCWCYSRVVLQLCSCAVIWLTQSPLATACLISMEEHLWAISWPCSWPLDTVMGCLATVDPTLHANFLSWSIIQALGTQI